MMEVRTTTAAGARGAGGITEEDVMKKNENENENYEMLQMNDIEIQRLVDERANERKKQNFQRADEIKQQLECYGILISDIPYRLGGGSTWIRKLDPLEDISLITLAKEVYAINDPKNNRVLDIINISKDYLKQIRRRREISLQWKLNDNNMLGRKYADIAFKFAMGGVDDTELFQLLSDGHLSEIQRFGHRKSCGIMDLAQMSEKLACAGIVDQEIYSTTAQLIRAKLDEAAGVGLNMNCSSLQGLESGEYSVLSDHPLRMLWRFAAKQSKHGKQRREETDLNFPHDDEREDDDVGPEFDEDREDISPESLNLFPDLLSLFGDNTRPLVIDLGCGFGTALLGLCTSLKGGSIQSIPLESPTKRIKFDDSVSSNKRRFVEIQRTIWERGCNFLGCDMSKRAIGYATSLANRWKVQDRCKFLHCSVEMLLDSLLSSNYPGPVVWISVNFPTPYSQRLLPYVFDLNLYVKSKMMLPTSDHLKSCELKSLDLVGNSQLPESIDDFMATPQLFRKCALLFERQLDSPILGFLYLQSNVEDVALTMKTFVDFLSLKDIEDISVTPFSELNYPWERDQKGKFRWIENSGHSITPTELLSLWTINANDTEEWATIETATNNHSKRQEIWLSLGAQHSFRTVGNGWWKGSPLPSKARTETEAVCSYQQKPIHRIVFSYSP